MREDFFVIYTVMGIDAKATPLNTPIKEAYFDRIDASPT